jgi:two-component system chemotaxis sensor kinase CheA
MEKFQQRFIEEAQEYFDSLESVLLNLNNDLGNKQLISEIFRIMHSLKGSGAMFGFVLLSEITHELESLYESVRSGRIPLDHQIINFTLNAVDKLRQLLELNPGAKEQALSEQLKIDIASFVDKVPEAPSASLSFSNNINAQAQTKATEKSLFIYFEPDARILSNGTNPLYLIDELCSLGSSAVKVDLSKLPDFEDFDAESCYVSWRMVLVTIEEIEAIQDVFLFVQDHSKIEITELKKGNILNDQAQTDNCFLLPLEKIVPFESESRGIELLDAKPEKIVSKTKREELVAGVQLSTIRVNSAKIDAYMNLVSELITAQSQLDLLSEKNKELESISEHFGKLIRQLRDNAFDMGLIPLNNMATRFKRLVHDLSTELNKEVELVTEGLETELDKNIIEKLGEPLLHIIRNCIDHGIETVDERLALGKTKAGVIIIKASYVGTFVEIEITDDGRGLDLEKIREKAIRKSLIPEDEELSDSVLISLIFAPGFSTTDSLSDVSGRGIGMDIVRSRIKDLRGDIEVDTKKGEGTNFTIRLPLTLSIIDGLLTKVIDDFYVFPTSTIEKIYALTNDVKRNLRRQVVVFEGKEIPFLDLRKEFNPGAESLEQQYLIAVKYENGLFGLVVDDVIREYQAVVKPLGEMLKHHDMFLGASILGDGKVSLVIDVKKTIQKFST